MIKICHLQDVCQDYTTGNNMPTNHHVRATWSCTQWLDYSCSVMSELLVIMRKATKEDSSCKITSKAKIKGKK